MATYGRYKTKVEAEQAAKQHEGAEVWHQPEEWNNEPGGYWAVGHKTDIPQEPGMRLNYGTILPKIAEELTGDKGEKVSLGEHKNAFEHSGNTEEHELIPGEKVQRSNLIFRNADGTPKTDVSGKMYRIKSKYDILADTLNKLKVNTNGQLHAFGILPATWNGAIDIARMVVKAGGAIHTAISAAIQHIKENHQGPWDEAGATKHLEEQLGKGETPAVESNNKGRAVNRDLESTTSKDLGAAGKMFGSVLDRIRAINHPGAKPLADALQRGLVEKHRLVGKYANFMQEVGNKLPTNQYKIVNDSIESYLTKKIIPTGLPKEAQAFMDAYISKYKELGQEHIASHIPIKEKGGQVRHMVPEDFKLPTMSNQKVEEMLRKNEDFAGIQKTKGEFIKYQVETLKHPPQEALAKWDRFQKSCQGAKGFSSPDWFNAVRKSLGDSLPPSMREQNPVKAAVRYFDRAAASMAHYTQVEADPKAMAALGKKKNGWGQEIPQYKEGPISNNALVKVAVDQSHTTPRDATEQLEHGLSSVATQLFVQGPTLQAHVVISNALKATLQGLQGAGYYHGIRAVGAALSNLREGWGRAVKGGLVKLPAIQARDMLDSSLKTHVRMGGLAKALRDISTIGGLTTKGNAGFLQAYMEQVIPSMVNRANAKNRTAQQMLKHWDVDYKVGKTYDQAGIQRLASIAGSYVHGTGDIRQMPPWMMKEGEISGFMQLAHWSTAQTNNFLHDVWLPAKRGNIEPLVLGLFGSAIGGYAIKELREKLQGKKGQIPSLGEIAASEKGLEGNGSLLMYNAIAGMQYAGFGGLFSQVAKYPFDLTYKNNPQGLTFPLDEISTDMIKTIGEVTTAMANDPNVNYVDLAAAVGQHLLGSNIKLASIALNQGMNNGLITGLPAEKKALADKLGELRRFDMVTGLPYNEVDAGSNPYMNIEQKKFKMEQDPAKAVQMLPGLISNIMERYHDNPDVMMTKIKALKQNSYETFPSMENAPLSFYKYLGYLQREEGPEKAQEALMDFMRHKTINEVKGSVVP